MHTRRHTKRAFNENTNTVYLPRCLWHASRIDGLSLGPPKEFCASSDDFLPPCLSPLGPQSHTNPKDSPTTPPNEEKHTSELQVQGEAACFLTATTKGLIHKWRRCGGNYINARMQGGMPLSAHTHKDCMLYSRASILAEFASEGEANRAHAR